jgi:hypothetical protein
MRAWHLMFPGCLWLPLPNLTSLLFRVKGEQVKIAFAAEMEIAFVGEMESKRTTMHSSNVLNIDVDPFFIVEFACPVLLLVTCRLYFCRS